MLEPVGPDKDVNPLVTVFSEQVITSHNQLEYSQLENPPDINLQAKQTVAHDGDDKSNDRHYKRCDGVGIVTLRNHRPVAMDRSPLPKTERDQKRREDQRDQAVRYEYDPERYDHQSHQHYRGVYAPAETVPELPREGVHKLTKVVIITRQNKLEEFMHAMNEIGVTGITITNVLGCGIQKGAPSFYRGVEMDMNLLPKVKIEIVVSLVPVQKVIATAKKVLHTGQIGDGKVFVYDIENVVKIRTGEEGYLALQDTAEK